ncbi:MAG: TIGR00730 family Rossman fold protein [Candidatus Korobacteraceae bacterium]
MADHTNFIAPLAYENDIFLKGPDGRPLRILAEYAEPLARFRREKIQDTVVFFGSARFHSLSNAKGAAQHFDPAASSQKSSSLKPAPEQAQAAYRAQRAVDMARYYEDARRLAHMLTSWSRTLGGKRHRFVVTTGGGPGIMEAANRGAREAGGKTIGLNIALPAEQAPNPYITPELNFEFHYFFMRKLWFAYLAKALVVFPGGFGTLDELFEILTLAQTEKLAKKMTVLVYGSEYWRRVLNLEALADAGTISPEDVNLFQYVDNPDEAFARLQENLTRDHLQSPPPANRHQPEIATTRR